ncbi:cation transporter [bacterium]|nr:cation transporter [bacterium]
MPHNHTNKTDNIRLAFFLNLGFAMLEILGGFWTNSMAILSDALHDFGDSFSLGLAWFFERFSRRQHDNKYSYGYKRFSVLGAFFNIIVLFGGSLFVLCEAVPRLLKPESIHTPGMAAFAIVGIGVNGFVMLRLRKQHAMNARVVALHMLEDMLGWVAVLIVSIALLFTGLYILDPLLSIIITAVILLNVIRNLKKTAALFLQAGPENIPINEIEYQLLQINNVNSVHHTHAWSLDGEHHVLTTHIVIREGTPSAEIPKIKAQVRELGRKYNFIHITVETEFGDESCSMQG